MPAWEKLIAPHTMRKTEVSDNWDCGGRDGALVSADKE